MGELQCNLRRDCPNSVSVMSVVIGVSKQPIKVIGLSDKYALRVSSVYSLVNGGEKYIALLEVEITHSVCEGKAHDLYLAEVQKLP